MTWRIGVDIGGTFTDVALVDDTSGRIGVAKVPTTPHELSEGVRSALKTAMARYQVSAAEVNLLSHATTVVTNAILEQTGTRAALVTTRGFRDVLELRRSARANLYDLFQDAPSVLIPRRRRFEITERIGADGSVVTPLAETQIDELIAALEAAGVGAIAISLIFSFLNPEHERRLAARDPALPVVFVTHYPLVREPTRVLRYPLFAQWCGTIRTSDWHLRFSAAAVVYGHLHIPRVTWYDGVRFEEVSMGYPREWRRRDVPPGVPRQILPAAPEPATPAQDPRVRPRP